MSQNSKGARRTSRGLRLWTHSRALAALPYVAPVVRSLREHWIEMRAQRLRARRLAAQPGRPDRSAMIAQHEAQQETQRASAGYTEAQKELQALGITCVDPVRGLVLFPFQHKKKLAWFLYDTYEEEPLTHWRYQDDAVDVRRPVAAIEEGAAGPFSVG
jgi:hypothetical protein